jgi:biopolymer transport protein ExbB/TolQ
MRSWMIFLVLMQLVTNALLIAENVRCLRATRRAWRAWNTERALSNDIIEAGNRLLASSTKLIGTLKKEQVQARALLRARDDETITEAIVRRFGQDRPDRELS